jgi:hypothetical protein
MQYEINFEDRTCLPSDLDKSNFVEMTVIGDSWRQFLDAETGKVHDCSEYYKLSLEQTFQEVKQC